MKIYFITGNVRKVGEAKLACEPAGIEIVQKQVEIDEIAERILTLGGTPLHAYSDFSQHTNIQEDKNVKDGNACVQGVVTGLQALIEEQREVSALAERAEDQGTADLVDEYVQQQEKLVWMYNAFLAK